MTEPLSEGIHPDFLAQLESLGYVLLPDTLDAEVWELHRHILAVDVHGAHALLAAIPAHAGWADQVVGVGLGTSLAVVGDAADHHHGRARAAHQLQKITYVLGFLCNF